MALSGESIGFAASSEGESSEARFQSIKDHSAHERQNTLNGVPAILVRLHASAVMGTNFYMLRCHIRHLHDE